MLRPVGLTVDQVAGAKVKPKRQMIATKHLSFPHEEQGYHHCLCQGQIHKKICILL